MGVSDVFVQDYFLEDSLGHAGMMWDRSMWGLVINALLETNHTLFACDEGLPL
jgi:hypothetical protein